MKELLNYLVQDDSDATNFQRLERILILDREKGKEEGGAELILCIMATNTMKLRLNVLLTKADPAIFTDPA